MHAKAKFSRSKSLSIFIKQHDDKEAHQARREQEKLERKRRAISVGKTVSASPVRARHQQSFSPVLARRNSLVKSAGVALGMKFNNSDLFGVRQEDCVTPQRVSTADDTNRFASPIGRMSRRFSVTSAQPTDGGTSTRSSLSKKELNEALDAARERMLHHRRGLKTRYKSPASAPSMRTRPLTFEVPREEAPTRKNSAVQSNTHRVTRVASMMKKLQNLDVMDSSHLKDLKNIDEVNAKVPSTPECPKNMYDVTGFMATKRFASRSKSRSRSRNSFQTPPRRDNARSQGEDPRDETSNTEKTAKRIVRRKIVKRSRPTSALRRKSLREDSLVAPPSPATASSNVSTPKKMKKTKRKSAKKRPNVTRGDTMPPQIESRDLLTYSDALHESDTPPQSHMPKHDDTPLDRESLLHHLSQPDTTLTDILSGIKEFSDKQKNRQVTIPDISKLLDDVRDAKNAMKLRHVQTKTHRSHLTEIRDKRKRDNLKKSKTKASRSDVLSAIRQKRKLPYTEESVGKTRGVSDGMQEEETDVKQCEQMDTSVADVESAHDEELLEESAEVALMGDRSTLGTSEVDTQSQTIEQKDERSHSETGMDHESAIADSHDTEQPAIAQEADERIEVSPTVPDNSQDSISIEKNGERDELVQDEIDEVPSPQESQSLERDTSESLPVSSQVSQELVHDELDNILTPPDSNNTERVNITEEAHSREAVRTQEKEEKTSLENFQSVDAGQTEENSTVIQKEEPSENLTPIESEVVDHLNDTKIERSLEDEDSEIAVDNTNIDAELRSREMSNVQENVVGSMEFVTKDTRHEMLDQDDELQEGDSEKDDSRRVQSAGTKLGLTSC